MQYIKVYVFCLVKKCTDDAFFIEAHPWLGYCMLLNEDSCDVKKSIEQIEVFGATYLHNSMFALGAKNFHSFLVACFALYVVLTPFI